MSSNQNVSLARFDTRLHPCPICAGNSFSALARNDRNLLGVETVGCNSCGLIQTNPRPSAEGLTTFYRDHYRLYYQGATAPDARYIADLNKDIRLANTAAFFSNALQLPKDAVILDYGCGEGSLFAALRKASFSGAFYGVELNASFGEFASRYGNATVSNSIRSREPVDLAIVNHVLEHLSDPIATLKELGRLLKRGGLLYIDVPDAEEYDSIQDLHIAHIYHFTERTLGRLVEQAGFVVTTVEKHVPPHHPRSVRLVARLPTDDEARVVVRTDASSEQAAWQAVRRAGKWAGTVRLRLRRLKMAREIYRFAKRLSSGRSA